jgi:hypothetical protein
MRSVSHIVGVKYGCVYLVNEEDSTYEQRFTTPEQIDEFIKKLVEARRQCFPPGETVPDLLTGVDVDFRIESETDKSSSAHQP